MASTAVVLDRPATYQDILDAPDHMVAEIIGGALHMQPRPAPKHARSASTLGMQLGGPFDLGQGGPGGWVILDEPEVHLGADVIVPDLAGWRRARMPMLPDTAYFTLAPDWACEVLSPSTRRLDLTCKRDLYAREGVGYLWFVDPLEQTLEAFELTDGRWALITAVSETDMVSLPPFDAIRFPLGTLWDLPQ